MSSAAAGFLGRSSSNNSNMRGLVQFIADLRNARARELEEKRINKELANIRYGTPPPPSPSGANSLLTYGCFPPDKNSKVRTPPPLSLDADANPTTGRAADTIQMATSADTTKRNMSARCDNSSTSARKRENGC